MLCTVEEYQIVTADSVSATAEVEVALVRAQSLLEEALGRRGLLEWGAHTETLRLHSDWTVYPTCTPVDSTTGGYTVVDDIVYGAILDASLTFDTIDGYAPPAHTTITYQGGYSTGVGVPDRNETPRCIVDDLAWAARTLLMAGATTTYPLDALAVRSGDQSVTFATPVGLRPDIDWSDETMAYRRSP